MRSEASSRRCWKLRTRVFTWEKAKCATVRIEAMVIGNLLDGYRWLSPPAMGSLSTIVDICSRNYTMFTHLVRHVGALVGCCGAWSVDLWGDEGSTRVV